MHLEPLLWVHPLVSSMCAPCWQFWIFWEKFEIRIHSWGEVARDRFFVILLRLESLWKPFLTIRFLTPFPPSLSLVKFYFVWTKFWWWTSVTVGGCPTLVIDLRFQNYEERNYKHDSWIFFIIMMLFRPHLFLWFFEFNFIWSACLICFFGIWGQVLAKDHKLVSSYVIIHSKYLLLLNLPSIILNVWWIKFESTLLVSHLFSSI